MNHDVSTIAHGSPLAGAVLVATGATAWAYSTVVKVFAVPGVLFAQAAVPGLHMSWADFGQAVGGVCSLAGIVVTCYVTARSKLAKGENERKFEAGLTDVKLFMAAEMAKIQVHQARLSDHLGRQDAAIQQVASAVVATDGKGDAAK